MPRSRSFDEPTVLAGAMHVFRQVGFAATSIRDLERATGLSAGSLYNAYGDKGGLFDAAYAHYLEAVLRQRIERHAAPDAGLAGVRKLFTTLLSEPRGERFGCLITNSAIEFGGAGDAREALAAAGFEILRQALHQRLVDARRQGRVRAGIDPAVAAVKLVALYQGVLVMVRAGHDRAALRRAIDLEFDSLAKDKP